MVPRAGMPNHGIVIIGVRQHVTVLAPFHHGKQAVPRRGGHEKTADIPGIDRSVAQPKRGIMQTGGNDGTETGEQTALFKDDVSGQVAPSRGKGQVEIVVSGRE